MRRQFFSAATAFLISIGAGGVAFADEEYDCTIGGTEVSTSSVLYQLSEPPHPQVIVYLNAKTTRSATDQANCPGWMRIEGWIDGGDGVLVKQSTTQIVQIGGTSSQGSMELSKVAPYVCGETHTGHSKHWWIKNGYFGDPWTHIVDKDPTVTIPNCDPPPDDPPGDGDPEDDGGPGCSSSPLVFDRNGDGINLTSPSEGVMFDIDADGIPDRVAWTRADSDDAWLAIDRNGNGRIDDGSELFGNNTPVYADLLVRAKNGFEALKFLESPSYGPSKTDEVIDAKDTGFARLLIWIDANHNGISEPDELQSAAAAGLVSVGTVYEERKRRDEYGNEFRQKGESHWLNAGGRVRKTLVWDVWLQTAR
jgi:hypothetical protein